MAAVRMSKQRKEEYNCPFITFFCLLEMQLYLKCTELYFLLLVINEADTSERQLTIS